MKLSFSTFNRKILYLTIPTICRKNLTQSDFMDCKIATIEGEEKVCLVGNPNRCQYFEFQLKLGG
jgi:hypothetical protein